MALFFPVASIIKSIYRQSAFDILALSLSKEPPTICPSATDLVFREVSQADSQALNGLWRPPYRAWKMRRLKHRLANGCIGIAAWHNGALVGLSWFSRDGETEPLTGLFVKPHVGDCYGFDLYEHEMYQDQGIALATLASAVQEARKRGFSNHFMIVNSEEERLIKEATELLGFRKIGEIKTVRMLGKRFSKWRVGERTSKKRVLDL